MVDKNYIYVLKHLEGIKIGRTNNLKSRLNGHKTSNPWIEFVKSYEAPVSCEKYIHKKLNKYLKQGCTEWFTYYDGIYNDIDKYIAEGIEIENKLRDERILREQKRAFEALEKSSLKVFKFKDIHRNDFAFVVAENKLRAEMLLKITTFVKLSYIGFKSLNCLDKFIGVNEYIPISQIRTKDEYHWCMTHKVDYNKEYGITIPRRKELMVIKDYIPYQKRVGFKKSNKGINKNNKHKVYKQYNNN